MAEDETEFLSLLETSVTAFLAQRHDRKRIRRAPADFALWPEMAELGLLAQTLSEADGGAGMGPAAVALVARLMGERLVPEPYAACAAMPAALIGALPAGALREDLAAAVAGGEERLSLAWQSAPADIDPFAPGCELDGEGRLSGRRVFVVAPDRRALVTARQGGAPVLALVELDARGVTVTTQPASDGLDYAELSFAAAAVVGAAPLLAGVAAEAAVTAALDVGLLAAAARLTGLIYGVQELTLEHLRTRVQFEHRIGSFQALQHRAVEQRVSLALCEASVRQAVRLMSQSPGSAQASAAVSAAKARASAAALSACKEAIQMHGAIGFTEEADVGLFTRAALKWASWLGGAREHRLRFLDNEGELIHGR